MTAPAVERRYSPDHVWLDTGGEVGVTARLLARMPELAQIHLPAVGATIRTAQPMGALESHKGAIDLYAPCDGVVRARNEEALADLRGLADDPERTWLIRVDGTPGRLLSAEEYAARAGAS